MPLSPARNGRHRRASGRRLRHRARRSGRGLGSQPAGVRRHGEAEERLTVAFVADVAHDWPPPPRQGSRLGCQRGRSTASTISWRPAERRSCSPPLSAGRHHLTRTCSSPPTPSAVRRRADRPASRARAPHQRRRARGAHRGTRRLGIFGLSAPVEYGGFAEGGINDYLGMVVATEELSRGSLGIGGSLITRPEILTRALIAGGTEDQNSTGCLGLPRARSWPPSRSPSRTTDPTSPAFGWAPPRPMAVGHQRREDMVHLRRPGRRVDGARPHRAGHHRPQGSVGLHRREAEGRWPRLRARPGWRRQDDRAGDRHARLPRMHSYEVASRTGSSPRRTSSARRPVGAGASTTRCRASRTADSRPQPERSE